MEKVNRKKLERVGNELTDLHLNGRLDFPAFQRLFHEAIAVCGPDCDDMEMFCQFSRLPEWRDWMTQELQKAPTRRVA